jgi:hypothetical protein
MREAFTDFLLGLLDPDPTTRWTPRQAARHPFLTGEPFRGPFQPQPDLTRANAPPRAAPGVPMAIPGGGNAVAAAAVAAAAAAASPWATSPHVHAQAHAAAVAAVHAQMSLRQAPGSYAGLAQSQPLQVQPQAAKQAQQPEYSAAHSLQRIMPPGASARGAAHSSGQQALSFGAGMLMSPPSRAFNAQLKFSDAQMQQMQALSETQQVHGGVMPLLHTPFHVGSVGAAQGMFSASFQPSSVSTYQAALAAAGAALEERQQATLLSQSIQQAALASYQAQQAQLAQSPLTSAAALAWGASQAQEKAASAWHASESSVGHRYSYTAPLIPQQEQLPQQQHQPLHRWASIDGSTEETPRREASTAVEDEPNPADWDPLWSDDLLREDEGGARQATGHSPGVAVGVAAATFSALSREGTGRAAQPAMAPSAKNPYDSVWSPGQQQQQALTRNKDLNSGSVDKAAAIAATAVASAERLQGLQYTAQQLSQMNNQQGPRVPASINEASNGGDAGNMMWSPSRQQSLPVAPTAPQQPMQRLHGFDLK